MQPVTRSNEKDRRKKTRFPMVRELRYKLVEENRIVAQGTGETIDIGSNGVSFLSGQPLKVGTYIELSISWPVMLGENTRMRLVAFGRLVRSSSRVTACTIDKYEFRVQARAETSDPNVRRDSMLQRWVEEVQRDSFKMRGALA